MRGSVAEWLGRWTCDQQIADSNHGRRVVECNPGQVVHTSTSSSTIIGTGQNGRRRSAAGYITAGLAERLHNQQPGLWLRPVHLRADYPGIFIGYGTANICLFNVPCPVKWKILIIREKSSFVGLMIPLSVHFRFQYRPTPVIVF